MNLLISERVNEPGAMYRAVLSVSRPPNGDMPDDKVQFAQAVIRHFGPDREDDLMNVLASCARQTMHTAEFTFEFNCVHGGAITTQKVFILPKY